MDLSIIPSLAELMGEIPEDSIVSRTVLTNDHLKAVLFGFASGQELSEHTAARPAVLHFLTGEAELTLGDESMKAGVGSWIHMPPNLPHSVRAITPVTMLLLILKT